jgi:tRNA (mo5U34)-methyltransferase
MTSELLAKVDSNPLWYHTIDLGAGVVTPGWFDLRPILDVMPWPDVAGKRCLDVGTYDGFLAFELERRGAAEVVATDISDHTKWDWPVDIRAQGPEHLAHVAGPQKGLGFSIAKDALGSKVEKVEINVYDLDPESVGTFDVVICGSLMLHLRDPLRALAAIRSVCGGQFLSAETVDLRLSLQHRRRAVSVLNGLGGNLHWTIPNVAGHKRMLRASGFEVERASKPYCIPFGVTHPAAQTEQGRRKQEGRRLKRRIERGLERVMAGGPGVPHSAVLTRAV